ncbi:MAG: FGGY-family carbohydrate kinase, partial [Cyclobacteriaceae bacterium]|nr:FGGY-family carbohydrate kinase [Cyclobacteriaceae bacterium]
WNSYEEMNAKIEDIPPGSDGLHVMPFGNGAERVIGDRNIGCSVHGLNFNRHDKRHIARASQEGIVFSLIYGLTIMRSLGVAPSAIRAGYANMFLSPVFRQTLSDLAGVPIELYNTSGAEGAAIGAGIGLGYFSSYKEAFEKLDKRLTVVPRKSEGLLEDSYKAWEAILLEILKNN